MATAAEIQADIDTLRDARLKLARGERVEEVSRDGRRLIFTKVTLESLTALIAILESDLEKATAVEGGRPSRRAIPLRYAN